MRTLIVMLLLCCGLMAGDYSLGVTENAKHGNVEADGTSITYTHDASGGALTSVLIDSFSLNATDNNNNTSDPTQMYVQVIPLGINVYVYPNPASMDNGNVLNNDIPSMDGIISILFISEPVEGGEIVVNGIDGQVKILDAVGNMVASLNIKQPDYLTSDVKYCVGYVAWDGRNTNGRPLGSGSVIALMDVTMDLSIAFDGVNDMNGHVELTKTYMKAIGIKHE